MVFDEIKRYNHEIKELIDELISYKQFEDRIKKDLKTLHLEYQRGKFEYEEYLRIKKELLLKEDTSALNEYTEYIINLVDRIEYLNTQTFFLVYDDKSSEKIKIHKDQLEILKKFEKKKEEHDIQRISSRIEDLEKEDSELESAEKSEKLEEKKKEKTALEILQEKKKQKKDPLYNLKQAAGQKKEKKKGLSLFPKKKTLFEKLKDAEKDQKKSTDSKVQFGSVMNIGIIRTIFNKIKKEDHFISTKTKKTHSLLELKDLISDENESFEPSKANMFAKETSHIKKLLDSNNVNIYRPSSMGYLANFFVRRFSLYFIESYPNFFKDFYLTLRKANIKVLSNTYVNIMFFSAFMISSAVFGITLLISLVLQDSIAVLLAKTILATITFFMITVGIFYYYPFMKVSERKKSINTNLPFSIDQMASVVSSGVSPSTMFKLIAKTKDYGEVSSEIEKISNLIEVFGYDLVSAVRSITITTPSKSLREFFEGFISTVETGGSLKKYFSQKSKEAMLAYQLERQKYLESISTYSDIYTGLLIAAPLFFVSTLSLVSLLGGKVGSLEVSTLMVLGTYIAIPMLNILFIVFLELNQPEV